MQALEAESITDLLPPVAYLTTLGVRKHVVTIFNVFVFTYLI